MHNRIAAHFLQSAQLKQQLAQSPMCQSIADAVQMLFATISNGQRVFACGNGGSAADSQHFVAELVGRFEAERIGLPAIALSTDTSILTAVGNDYGYDYVFARQIEALAQTGDTLLAISTSGNSENVLRAIKAAQERGVTVIGLSGRDGGKFNQVLGENDIHISVPHPKTARIQEVHITVIHCLCDGLDMLLLGNE